MSRVNWIGKRLPRTDGVGKVTGQTRFLPDESHGDILYAAPVYAATAHAILKSLDINPVAKDPDFVAFFAATDIPGDNQVGVIIEDQPLLVEDHIRYWGDCIGILVARTPAAALRLAAGVHFDFSELSPIYDLDTARQSDAGSIHPDRLACSHQVDRGDVESGFSHSAEIVEVRLRTPVQEHYYLEPQACLARPDGRGGMEIRGSLQCPYYIQKAVARNLGIRYSQVRVEQAPTGGAFGGKEDVPSEVCARTALAAWLLDQPVRMIYQRKDDIQLTSKRHPFEMNFRVGVSREGKLLAADILLDEGAGAYATLSSVVSYRSAMQALGPYVIPNIRVRSRSWYTNLPPNGAFRGFGSPQATFGHERVMDHIARALDLDPIEFRLRNILQTGSPTLTGQVLDHSVGAAETLRQARASMNRDQDRMPALSPRYRRGFGVAAIHYGNCLGAAGWALDGSAARIQIHRDGSVTVAFGLVEMGQGALTAITQMTAEALGVQPGDIEVLPTETHQVPDSGPAVASRNVVMTGNAIRQAAERIRPILLQTAAALLGCAVEQVILENGVARNGNDGRETDFRSIAEEMFLRNRDMETLGWWHVPELDYDPDHGVGEAYFTYSFATHIAAVQVDTVTGRVRVEKIWAAHDVGRAINPAGIEAQVEGGTAQGLGWALTEDLQFEGGRVNTPNLSTYLLPTAMDVGEVETILVEEAEPLGPWGAKGIGEPAIIPTAAAIANAVSDAIGKPVDEIPIRPTTILEYLEQANA